MNYFIITLEPANESYYWVFP